MEIKGELLIALFGVFLGIANTILIYLFNKKMMKSKFNSKKLKKLQNIMDTFSKIPAPSDRDLMITMQDKSITDEDKSAQYIQFILEYKKMFLDASGIYLANKNSWSKNRQKEIDDIYNMYLLKEKELDETIQSNGTNYSDVAVELLNVISSFSNLIIKSLNEEIERISDDLYN